MEITLIIALGFALWFFYQSLQHLLTWLAAPPPGKPLSQFMLFVYCLFAGILLLYESGLLTLGGRLGGLGGHG